jgi:hypothetical protein
MKLLRNSAVLSFVTFTVVSDQSWRFRRVFEIVSGLTLILMGFYMLNAVLFWILELAI